MRFALTSFLSRSTKEKPHEKQERDVRARVADETFRSSRFRFAGQNAQEQQQQQQTRRRLQSESNSGGEEPRRRRPQSRFNGIGMRRRDEK